MPNQIYAVLVGVNEYAPPGPTLSGCVNDIKAVEGLLRDKYNCNDTNIKRLTDDDSECLPSKKIS